MNWQHTINFNQTLQTLEGNDNIVEVRQRLADVLRIESKKLPEILRTHFEDFAIAMEICEDTEEMEYVLQDIYDFADENSIWLGL